MNIDMLQSLLIPMFLLGALIAAGIFAFHFLRRSKFGKQMGLPTPRPRRVNLIERAHLDNGRKLLLVRRDDVEHLVMIGGPIDILVETGIQRPRIPYPRSADRDIMDGINNRQHTDWGLHREPPPHSDTMVFPIQPELSLATGRPLVAEDANSLDQKLPADPKSIQ